MAQAVGVVVAVQAEVALTLVVVRSPTQMRLAAEVGI